MTQPQTPAPAQGSRASDPDGYNGCYRQAIAALNYLAQYPRPNGGQSQFNAEHLLQIADEMKRSRRSPAPATADCSCARAGFPGSCDNCDAEAGPIKFWRERALAAEAELSDGNHIMHAPATTGDGADWVLMPREATRAMTMAGCDYLPSCEHVFGYAGEMLRNAYAKMVEVAGSQSPAASTPLSPKDVLDKIGWSNTTVNAGLVSAVLREYDVRPK